MTLPPRHAKHQAGLTLVEVLVAVTLGLIVLAALIGVFIANSQNYRQNDAVVAMQDNARFALDLLSRDLAMAGYWGGVRPLDADISILVSNAAAAAVSITATPGDCGPASEAVGENWLFKVGTGIEFRNHLASGSPADRFRCLTAVKANTDIVVIRRAAGQAARELAAGSSATSVSLAANRYYLKTNQNSGAIFRFPASGTLNLDQPIDCPDSSGLPSNCPPSAVPIQYYAYSPRIYYVRDHNAAVGDGAPILCRWALDDTLATPAMAEECLAEGVENLQIEWGINSDGDANGVVDRYYTEPTADQLKQAVSARIHILVRALATSTQASSDARNFTLGDYASASDAGFVATGILRRSYTTTVQLKNYQP